MQARILEQSQIEHCKNACKTYFEQKNLNVILDEPISANIEWAPMIYARNGEQYGVHVRTKPSLESFRMDIFRTNVRPLQPNLKVCLAFPFDVALRITHGTLTNWIKEKLSVITVYDDGTLSFFDNELHEVPSNTANEIIQHLRDGKAEVLSNELCNCQRGKPYYVQYENLCEDIFKTIFVPPLGHPLSQRTTLSTLKRRDHVFPNYAREGNFWFDVFKQTYFGTYVVVECKNLTSKVTQEEIRDTAKYLNKKSTGLFALLLSREDPNTNAKRMQSEEWLDNQKLILTLNDEDLLSIIELYRQQDDPSQVIQQKIDDFMVMVG